MAPDSPLDTLTPDYRAEAVRWVQYHEDYTRIPGIHCDFTERSLRFYLRYRSETNKNLQLILCKLKKMGEACGYVLCTSKYQQPSLQYQQLRTTQNELKKQRRLAGRDKETNEALATGRFAVTWVLSGFNVRSARKFRPFHPLIRELVAIHTMQHGGCMRFGIFESTDILREDLTFSAHDECYKLRTCWRKKRKSNRPYTIKFRCSPPAGDPDEYIIPASRSPTITSTGIVIRWYLQASGLLHAPGKDPLFPYLQRINDRRGTYTRWLQKVYAALLPPGSPISRRIRPHSSRAGWATDRARDNVSTHTILLEGRWTDPRSMTKYIRTSLRDLVTSSRHRPIPPSMKLNPSNRR